MQQEIIKLTNDCLTYFKSNCYTQASVDKYKSMWKRGILAYMQEKNLIFYTAKVGEDFVDTLIKHGFDKGGEQRFIRSVQALTEFMNLGYVKKRSYTPVEPALDGELYRRTAHRTHVARTRNRI